MKRDSLIWITLVCIILGLAITAQFRTQAGLKSDIPTKRLEEMTDLLKQAETERDALREQVYELTVQINDILSTKSSPSDDLQEELKRVQMLAGLTELEGPGIVVTLNDSSLTVQPGQDPSLFLIHDDDLLKLINELKAAGAEAIAINGQRIVGSSEIRCAGPTISVNNTRIAPPYVVQAIGSPEALESSLNMRGGIIDTFKFWGIQVQIQKEDSLVLPSYIGSHHFQYARKTDGGEEKEP
ncbi:MAG: DUF881 domain-containing protein [Firmicutes bacterium]|nr:DUF881 domain-containing protein [Bacillota bacterium]